MTHQQAVDTLATERYLLEDMPDEDREAFEDHFFSCAECADDMRVAAAMLQGAKAGFAGTSTVGHVLPMTVKPPVVRNPAWYRSVALPWAAAATFAFAAAYQSLWVVPSLRQDTSPVAVVPVTLRPQSRGAEAVVDSRGGPTVLAVEVNDAPQGGELTYDLRTIDGRQVVSGRAAAPAPGSPLLLLMPSSTLVGSMHYILSVHDAAGTDRSLGEYRFTVSAQ